MKKFLLFCITVLTIFLSSQVSFAGKEKYGIFRRFMKTPRTMNIVSNICLGKKVPIKEAKPGRPIKDGYEIQFMYNLSGCTGVVARMAIGEYGGKIIIIDYSDRNTEYYYLLDELSDSSFGAINNSPMVIATPGSSPDEKEQTKTTPGSSGGTTTTSPPKSAFKKGVFKITKVYFDEKEKRYRFITDDDANRQKIKSFVVCAENFLKTPSGELAGCRYPVMLLADLNQTDGGIAKDYTFYLDSTCGEVIAFRQFHHARQQCLDKLANGYLIEVGAKDYLTGQGFLSEKDMLLISGDKKLYVGKPFYACQPKGRFTISKEGFITACDKIEIREPNRIDGYTAIGLYRMQLYFPLLIQGDYFIMIPK